MEESDIKNEIMERFPQFKFLHYYHSLIFPEFEFVKAVDSTLVDPKVKQKDFKTLKHIHGQGSNTIRSKKNVHIGFDDDNDSSSNNEDSEISELVSGIKSKGKRLLKLKKTDDVSVTQGPSKISALEESSVQGSSKTINDYLRKTLSCAVYFGKFPHTEIEVHCVLKNLMIWKKPSPIKAEILKRPQLL